MHSSQTSSPPATSPSPLPGIADTPSTAQELFEMSQIDLYALFRRSDAGPIPVGRGRGFPIAWPGTSLSRPLGRLLGTVVWRGKVFRPATEDLKNMLTPLSIPAIRAVVGRQDSWLDGRECIVLDYSRTSRVAGWIRDEIREVSPGLYLGLVYGVGGAFGGRRLLDVQFCLTFANARGAK
jgi:hypothetical protein